MVPGTRRQSSYLLPDPVANGPNTTQEVMGAVMHCPNALVHIFGDSPHPYVASLRLRSVGSSFSQIEKSRIISMKWWPRSACHAAPALPTSVLAIQWENPIHHDRELLTWATSKHDLLIPPAPVQHQSQPQPDPGLAQEVRGMREDLREARSRPHDTSDKSRRMKPDELRAYKGYCGLPRNAHEDKCPPFLAQWESTAQNESSMNKMLTTLLSAAPSSLGYNNYITFHPPTWIKDIKNVEFGQCLDKSFARAHRGLNIIATTGIKMDKEEAATRHANWGGWQNTTLHTGQDLDLLEGSPGLSPKSIMELVADLE